MNQLAITAATVLVTAIWQGALVAVVVALLLRALPGLSAATRSLIWSATFALLIALHFLPHEMQASNSRLAPAVYSLRLAPIWSIALGVMWLVLFLFRAIQFFVSVYHLMQVNRRSIPVDASLSGSLKVPVPTTYARTYTLCTSSEIDRPAVLGFLNPRILLPVDLLERLTPAELNQVLLHELEHLRRSDDWTNVLQKLALVIFPLNPILFWVERRLCLERELACDAHVLAAGETLRKPYATTLTRIAEYSILRHGLNLALGILGQNPRQSELSTRVHSILHQPKKKLNRVQTRFATATILAGTLALVSALAHSPNLITFTREPVSLEASTSPSTNPDSSFVKDHASLLPASQLVASRPAAQASQMPLYRTVQTAATLQAAPRHIRMTRNRSVAPQRSTRDVRLINTASRGQEFGPAQQTRFVLASSPETQVQQLLVPAVAYVPAYALVRTPGGWIIFQL